MAPRTADASAKLDPRHLVALRWQLVGALAMGWALGGCGGEAETAPSTPQGAAGSGTPPREADEADALPPSAPPDVAVDLPAPAPATSCMFGEADDVCYTREQQEAAVRFAPAESVTYTAEGCVGPETAVFAEFGCNPYPDPGQAGVRQGELCCYAACQASPVCGRPFVVGGAARVAGSRAGREWLGRASTDACEHPVDAEIGREWLRDALAEHASIASFSAFNLSLLALGAPAELVRACAAATLDEVRHARACFELASLYGGEPVGPDALDLSRLSLETDLVEVCVRTFLDGCVGETAAALVARAAADVCESPRVREVLERIADDEARHAELAWQFVAWAVGRGGDRVVQALSRAFERSLRELEGSDGRASSSLEKTAAPRGWHAAGRLSEGERARIAEQALRHVVRPLLDGLFASHRSMSSPGALRALGEDRGEARCAPRPRVGASA